MKLWTIGDGDEYQLLTSVSHEVNNIDGIVVDLCKKMISFMEVKKGIGLAAPQVGRPIRLFVYRIEEAEPVVCINPKLQAFSDKKSYYEEGCLSIPGVYAHIRRSVGVTFEAYDINGKLFQKSVSGLEAVVVQHENDHLDGRLFPEHLRKPARRKIFEKFGRVEAMASDRLII